MAKKNKKKEDEVEKRQSRKEILRARKHEQQQRLIRIAALVVAAILVVILLVAVVNELFLAPNQPVATVRGQGIALIDWQNRVRFERAQRIIALEDQLESFGGDVGLVQQFSSQSIVELISENAEALGEAILDRMVDEEIIRQGAEERGLLPTEADIDKQVGSIFNYYGGDSPTPNPTPTETIQPTPSITPISNGDEVTPEVTEEALANEEAPTSTPFPTATPVSEEAFQEEFNALIDRYKDMGVGEETYRNVVAQAITAERLMDALAEEQELPEDDVQANFLYLVFNDEEQANQAAEELANSDFLTVWNTFRSQTPDPAAENAPTVTASELVWRTKDTIESSFGTDVANAAFDLPIGTPSDVITISGGGTDNPVLVIIMVNGRETRPLDASELQARKQELVQNYIDQVPPGDIVINEFWRSRVPTSPILDPIFRQAPTAAPEITPDAGTGTDTSGE